MNKGAEEAEYLEAFKIVGHKKITLNKMNSQQSIKSQASLSVKDPPKLFYPINEEKILSMILDVLNTIYK